MAIAELDIGARTRGRAVKSVQTSYVRDLTSADLALLGSERGITAPGRKAMRERHHALARCLANGMSPAEASAVTGYGLSTISILKADESFQELLAHYGEQKDSAFADFQTRAQAAALTAVDIITERLEDAPEEVSLGQALEVVKTLADRSGHAPIARVQQTNVNVDLGTRLDAARRRLQNLQIVSSEPLPED